MEKTLKDRKGPNAYGSRTYAETRPVINSFSAKLQWLADSTRHHPEPFSQTVARKTIQFHCGILRLCLSSLYLYNQMFQGIHKMEVLCNPYVFEHSVYFCLSAVWRHFLWQ
jgi:hypothetical protein